jgi:hypothetical protein
MYYNLICIFICTPMWTKFYSCKKWVLQRTTKYEVFQPKNQEVRVFFLSHRTFGFEMLVQIDTSVCAF